VPHKAFLEIQVTLTKHGATADQLAGFTNPIAHVLFSGARYSINNTSIEYIDNHYPYSALVRGLTSKTRSWINTQGAMEGWALDGATSAGDVNINLNRNVNDATSINYAYVSDTTNAGIRNKLTFAGATSAAIVAELNQLNAGASVLRGAVQQATNPGFFKRLNYGFPVPGESVFTSSANTPGVPAQAAGGTLRGAEVATQSYTLKLPLSEVFAFCRDITKVFVGYFHTIEFTRNQNIDQMIQTVEGATVRTTAHITLDKVKLWMPYVKPSISMQAVLTDKLAKNDILPILFRPMRVHAYQFNPGAVTNYTLNWNVAVLDGRPEHIYFFMTHAGAGQTGISKMTFTSNFIKSLNITVGSVDYPTRTLEMDIEKKQGLLPYQMYLDCCGFNDTLTDPALTYRDWLKFYPIFCFDLTTVEPETFLGGKTLEIKGRMVSPIQADGFISSADNQAVPANNIADGAIHIPNFIAYAAIIYRKSGYLRTEKDGIKFISNS